VISLDISRVWEDPQCVSLSGYAARKGRIGANRVVPDDRGQLSHLLARGVRQARAFTMCTAMARAGRKTQDATRPSTRAGERSSVRRLRRVDLDGSWVPAGNRFQFPALDERRCEAATRTAIPGCAAGAARPVGSAGGGDSRSGAVLTPTKSGSTLPLFERLANTARRHC
jgi:hypothetical protein